MIYTNYAPETTIETRFDVVIDSKKHWFLFHKILFANGFKRHDGSRAVYFNKKVVTFPFSVNVDLIDKTFIYMNTVVEDYWSSEPIYTYEDFLIKYPKIVRTYKIKSL